jgi:hypothetical protein
MRFGRKTTFGAIGLLAALGAGGTAYAATSSGSSSASSPPTTSAAPVSSGSASSGSGSSGSGPAKHDRSLLGRADHATVEVKVKGKWVTYTIDRGKVTAVSPTSITLALPDGQSVTDTIGPSTRFKGVSSESQVQSNQLAEVTSDQGTALVVRQKATGSPTG